MAFRVTEVIDGDTFAVPGWRWDNGEGGVFHGDRVRIANFRAPEMHEPGGGSAKQQLSDAIYGKEVVLMNVRGLSYGRLVCDVYLNGENIVGQDFSGRPVLRGGEGGHPFRALLGGGEPRRF